MITIFGRILQNCLQASRVYAKRFPSRNHYNKTVLKKLWLDLDKVGVPSIKKLKETGDKNKIIIS